MASVYPCAVPAGSFLESYAQRGAFTDCYVAEVPAAVTQARFVEAFYTTWIFKIERWLLSVSLSRPSTDADVHELAYGTSTTFAAWSVEERAPDQLFVAAGRTRSWLMAVPANTPDTGTKLYFGSAVVPPRTSKPGASRMGWVFQLLLGFHKLYSRVLLTAACHRLMAGRQP